MPGCAHAVVMSEIVTVNDVLDGHTRLDVECLDRIYLNGYVPTLQVGGQVGGLVHDPAPETTDPVTGDHGEDRHPVPILGHGVRRR